MSRGRRTGRDINGWLVILKPAGISSAHAVAIVKRLTQAAKVGHGGTLDPFSEGLLPMALGRATKQLAHILEGNKGYRCWIRFGIETDSGDPTGVVVAENGIIPERALLEQALQAFLGPQEQVPPAHSAVHVNGVRAYELARRGETVELPPRQVVIHQLLLESYEEGVAQVLVRCSKGTYMRSLARDLGRHCGTVAHLQRLLRTETLGFSLEQGITLDQLAQVVSQEGLATVLLPMDRVLDDIPVSRPQVA
ncbi:tRNA pseudouridine(55) synthase TruB [Candidatus Magnetaquicoccus inordinatus]|uniref:tRNA pseudouridine(55) synthase TruB n=1 Tax=Candidatus Magnetaquicoccus inordinatus TaxID=2496818 RepID=UPI00102ACBBA|nr:tRNA pseudouridine(55) synthase TruB [Candidatus Magnetaquicoccus inordinatus]